MEVLKELGRLLVADLPIERSLADALRLVRDALHADRAAVFLGPPIRPVALYGLSVEYAQEVLVEYRRGPGGVAEAERKPLFIRDVQDAPASDEVSAWLRKAAAREGFRGLVLAPFAFDGQVNGGFSLYFNAPRMIAREERALVELFAQQLALAVETAHRGELCLEARRLSDEVLEELPIGVLVARAGQEPDLANRLARSILADSQLARVMASDRGVFDSRGTELCGPLNPMQRALIGECVESTELSIRTTRAGGRAIKTYLVSSSPSHGRCVTAFQDITRLREVDMYKDAVVAIAAHELRTPILALQLSSHTLGRRLEKVAERQSDDKKMDAVADVAHRIESQVSRLAVLMEHFLAAASVGARLEELQLARVDLNELVQSAAARVSSGHVASPHALRVRGVVGHVMGDRRWLTQAIDELIDNAITHGGGTVDVELCSAEERAVIRVLDRGGGVPNEYIPDLFERFTLARAALPAGGLGLGLYIAAVIARRHGGDLAYEPRPNGEGACFTLSLPYAGPPTP